MGERHSIFERIRSSFLRKGAVEVNRFAVVLMIVIVAKIVGALWLHHFWLHRSLGGLVDQPPSWVSLFYRWDSGWYLGIAEGGYSFHFPYSFAYFPGYPLLIFALLFVTGDPGASAVVPALVLGVAWIPLFQALAEHYMPRSEAIGCTLFVAFSPIVFLSTTVAYSESLFLFTTVASWYLYLKKRILHSCLLAAVSAVTRVTGTFLMVPMFLDLVLRRKWRSLPYTLIPPLALLGWIWYCFYGTGDWFAFWTVQAAWPWAGLGTLFRYIIPILLGVPTDIEGAVIIYLIFFALAGYLVFRLWDLDWRLAVYATLLLLVLLYGPPSIRYISFIFPLWLSLGTKDRTAIAASCAISYLLALILWHQFLTQGYDTLKMIMV